MKRAAVQVSSVETMYGLLLVVDPGNPNAEIPATGDDVSSTESCVAVPVRAYVDGPVSVWLGPSSAMPAGIEVFSGCVETPSRAIGVSVPEESWALSADVTASISMLRIVVDHPPGASRVSVGVGVESAASTGRV